MSQRPTRSPRRDDDRSTAPSSVSRRRLLHGSAAGVTLTAAGCLDVFASNESDDGPDSDDGSSDGGSNDDDGSGDESADLESELLEVIDVFLEAAADGDMDALDEVNHSLNPLNPAAWVEDGWEFQGGDEEEVGEYDAEVVEEDGSIDDVLELEGAAFWFAEVDLEEEIGDEEIALVELEAAEPDENGSIWVLVTEDDEWRVFFQGVEDDAPDDPEEAFEEEIIDEDGDVVEEIDWEYDQERDDQAGEDDAPDPFGDVEWAQVVLTDEPGIEADAVRIESTIEGSEFEVYGEEPGAWSGSWSNVALHPGGDQIVVTAITDGEETVVHREHYVPEPDSDS